MGNGGGEGDRVEGRFNGLRTMVLRSMQESSFKMRTCVYAEDSVVDFARSREPFGCFPPLFQPVGPSFKDLSEIPYTTGHDRYA